MLVAQFLNKNKKTIIIVIVIALIVGLLIFGVPKLIKNFKEDIFDRDAGEKINEWVTRFEIAFTWSISEGGTNEAEVYKLAQEIGTRDMFNKVSKKYKKKVGISLDDALASELESDEYNKFYSSLK